jgi:hypothetical protein
MSLYNKRNNRIRFIIWVSILLTHILIINNLSAQYQQEWIRKVSGTASNSADYGNNIAFDKQNNVYVAGYVKNSGTIYDYYLIKYNSAGYAIWNRTYNNPANNYDLLNSLTVDDFGNAYVTGSSDIPVNTNDCVTIKYDSSGNLKWINIYDYGVGKNDYGTVIKIDIDKNVYVCGKSYLTDFETDFLLIKYDSLGTQKWVRRCRGENVDNTVSDMVLDKSGNIYITGGSVRYSTLMDFLTIKYSANGDSLWSRRYDYDTLANIPLSIAIDSTGNICVTGYANDDVNNNTTLITLKYDGLGVLLWEKTYQNNPTNFNDYGFHMGIDRYNYIYVAGYTTVGPDIITNRDYLTIRYKPNGDTSWVRKYNGPGNNFDWPYKLAIDRQCNVYVTGGSTGSSGNMDYFTISYDTLGNVIWSTRYNGTGNNDDFAQYIALDNAQNLFVTGHAYELGTGGIVTMKFSKNVGIQNINENIPDNYVLYQNYPNPFNPVTNIKFNLPKPGFTKVEVYDMLGKKVETLVNQHLTPGNYKVTFDASHLSSGIYFYNLNSESFSETKRMILLK